MVKVRLRELREDVSMAIYWGKWWGRAGEARRGSVRAALTREVLGKRGGEVFALHLLGKGWGSALGKCSRWGSVRAALTGEGLGKCGHLLGMGGV